MRVLFCGSGVFAVQTLRAILATEYLLASVITAPARPAGRGGKLRPTAVATEAERQGLPVTTVEDINSDHSAEAIRRAAPDVLCVVDFGQFVSQTVRETAKLGAFNLHGSLLPELRGAAPVNWAIVRGHATTGVTTFSLVDRMDAGPIYASVETDIDPDETADQLRDRLAVLGGQLVCRTLGMLAAGWAEATPQDETRATTARRLKKADGIIDFTADAATVRNLIHGTWPWPGGQTVLRRSAAPDLPVIIARATAVDTPATGAPGTLTEGLGVATGQGQLHIRQIKPAGKRLMDWRDFVNGYRVAAGNCFVRPS